MPAQQARGIMWHTESERGEVLGMDTALETRNRSRHDARAIGGVVEFPLAVESVLSARTADAVFVVDPHHRVVHWDARAESLTGILSEEVLGKPCHEVVSGKCGDGGSSWARECSAMRMARAGQASPGYDMRIFTRASGRRWISVSILSVDTEEGPYLMHLVRDAQEAHETLEMARGLLRLSSGTGVPEKEIPVPRDVPALTPRQLEVLGLLSEGKSVREIGGELYLSQATVRNHVRSLLQALGAHSQLEALAKARALGLLAG